MNEQESRIEFLQQFLAERDLPCPLCGYNLRALRTDVCPECGSEVQVTVGLTEPRMGAFVAGVAGLAAGLGFNGLMLLWVGWMVIERRGGPPLDQVWPLPIGAIVTGVALMFWLRRRRAIRLMSVQKRWVLAVGCYVLSLAAAVMFFAVVRR